MSSNQMIQREATAKEVLRTKVKQIELLTGDKIKASKFASALVQLSQNKNLVDCKVESVLDVGFQIVQSGLNPNPLFGQAYIVPFKLKGGYTVAQLQIGYKGYIQLGYRAGWRFKAVAVYKCDLFEIEYGGFEDVITLKPDFDKRQEDKGAWVFKNLIGVIIYAKDKTDYISTEFVPFKKLEQLRCKSQNQVKEKLQHIWFEWAEEQYKAKALKYVVTRLPIEDEVRESLIKEDEVYTMDAPKVIPTSQPENEKPLDLNALSSAPIDIQVDPTPKEKMVKELIDRGATEKQAEMWCFGKEEVIQTFLNDPASIDVALSEAVGA